MAGGKTEQPSAAARLHCYQITQRSAGSDTFHHPLELPAKEIHETDYSAQEGPAKESFTSIAPDPIDDGERQRNIECAAVSDNKEELINDRCMAGETIDGAKERFVPTHDRFMVNSQRSMGRDKSLYSSFIQSCDQRNMHCSHLECLLTNDP